MTLAASKSSKGIFGIVQITTVADELEPALDGEDLGSKFCSAKLTSRRIGTNSGLAGVYNQEGDLWKADKPCAGCAGLVTESFPMWHSDSNR